MRKHFISKALTLALLFCATTASAQGVYIYKNGKKQVFKSEEVDSLVFFSTADNSTPSVSDETFELPVADFTKTLSDLKPEEEARGFSVNQPNSTKLVLEKTADGQTYHWEYNGNGQGVYMYAKCLIASEKIDAFKAFLRKQGYELEVGASMNDDVKVYVNKTAKTVVYINKEGSRAEYFFGAYDESFTSWTRVSFLNDNTTATWLPFYGRGATVELMQLFEKRMNHKLNAEKSKPDNGVYVYDTGETRWPSVKYWFDVHTKNSLEEASIFVDVNNIPTPEQVTTYLKTSNHIYTGMNDSEGDVIYYNYDQKSACFVKMEDKTGGKTEYLPQMHYAYADLSKQLPPLTVDFPMPIVTFGTKTLEEITAEYRKQSYYKSEETIDLGIVINTTSEDFPKILLLEDGGKYCAAMVITFNNLTARSPYIVDLLQKNGYENAVGVSALPTFINKQNNVMVQFDLNDILQMGWFTISFQPNEF
ncbi:hypothetical protein [Prevotella falsenii]|uniref:hypothetical protein n=1 Tax=Prevotella falsenii TaxID=515414 RepID=UPI000469DA02|nr:hypothetical protein [Prevotella falsenii]